MNYEHEIHSDWTKAVFFFTHNFISYEKEVVKGLTSESSEVKCASIAILNQSDSVAYREEIFGTVLDNEFILG